jgi:hypothetical protein
LTLTLKGANVGLAGLALLDSIPLSTLAFSRTQVARDCAIAKSTEAARERTHDGVGELTVLPLHIQFETTTGTKPLDRAVGPGLGQGRQQFNLTRTALQEHLADAGGAAEVAIDLERRMGIEHIRVGPLGPQQHREDLIRVFAVMEACPEVQTPADAQARGFVAANLQALARRRSQVGCRAHVNLIARIQPVQVRDMPVMHLWGLHVPIFQPFL